MGAAALPYVDKADLPWSSHALIRAHLEGLPPGAQVLDIGTAGGTVGRFCSQLGLLCKGVEPGPQWAELARPFYQDVWVGKVEDVPDDFLSGAQAVVLGDVLEHMPDPQAVLTRLVSLQPDDCRFIVSVPNIANLWVRLHVLSGHFDYAERGILDRTHLRFFTRRTFLALLSDCGLQASRLEPTPIPLELVSGFFTDHAVGRAANQLLVRCTRFWPTLLGYQFVACATRRASS
jgi:hypothetical protein